MCCCHSIFLLEVFRDWGQVGTLCRVRHLAELRGRMSELGEVEMAGIRKADHQGGEGLAEKVLRNSAWAPLESSVGY